MNALNHREHATCVAIFCLAIDVGALDAQQFSASARPTSAGELVAANALAGGFTAAVRALLDRSNPCKAFVGGAFGGIVHSSGKLVGNGQSLPSGAAGLVLSSVGVAMVANAGASKPLFDELFVPVGMVRLRWRPRTSAAPRASVSVYESVVFTELMLREGLKLDLGRTLRAGAFVFATRGRHIVADGQLADGITNGSAIVVSEFADNPPQTLHHELVHVKQHSFVGEAWGRPAETLLRRRLLGDKWLPAWLEIDILGQLMLTAEHRALGSRSVLQRLAEDEASAVAK